MAYVRKTEIQKQDTVPDTEKMVEFEDMLNQGLGLGGETDSSMELFATENIGARTDLSDDEIVYATKLKFLAQKYSMSSIDSMLDNFMMYKLSRKRKSRGEFIKVASDKVQNMMGMFGGGGMQR